MHLYPTSSPTIGRFTRVMLSTGWMRCSLIRWKHQYRWKANRIANYLTSQCACLQLCMKQLSHLHGRALWFPTYLSSTSKRDWDWSLQHSRLPECNILIRLLEKTTRKPQLTAKKHYHRAARGHGFPWSNTRLLRSLSRRSGRGELCTYMEN